MRVRELGEGSGVGAKGLARSLSLLGLWIDEEILLCRHRRCSIRCVTREGNGMMNSLWRLP